MKVARAAFSMLLLVSTLAIVAQTQEAPKGQQPEQKKAAEVAPGGQSAEGSREAGGEGAEDAQFKHSPSVRWIARVTGLSLGAAYWVAVIFNFAVIAAAIGLFWKSKIPAMFRARTQGIQRGMEEARRSSEDAQRRLGEIEARLSKLDGEIGGLRASAEQEAAAEEERIRAALEEDKRKVVEAAEQEILAATRLARRDLKAYAAGLAVALAEKQIHVDANTDRALVRSFVGQLSEPDSGGRRKEGS